MSLFKFFIFTSSLVRPHVSPHRLAKVVRVHDGDTISVSMRGQEVCVRLGAIDCPEDGQDWGEAAYREMYELVNDRDVQLEIHDTQDVYGRTVATVYVQQHDRLLNVNAHMVGRGYAWVYRRYYDYLSEERRVELLKNERWARNNRVGLWCLENPMAPWLWRKQVEIA